MITDTFGVTKAELEAIEVEVANLEAQGYTVPNIIVKFIHNANGLAGQNTIYIHPNTNLNELRFTVRHEVGHHYEPITSLNIWEDYNAEADRQASEDFANDFARRTA